MPPLRPIVFVDTETATLQGAPHLLELGAIRVEDGEVVDEFEELVLPRVEIDPEATDIHGIDDSMLRTASPAPEVLARYTEWVGDDWMGAHNAAFDARVLGFEYARAGLEPPPGPFLDTVALSKTHLGGAPDHKLETLCQYLDLEPGDHHRALADAVWCWQVFEACVEQAGGAEEVALTQWLGRSPMTISSRTPGPPRLNARLRSLERATREEVLVTLLYGEGMAKPTPLPVHPRFLFERGGKGYLEGECGRTGLLKTYLLNKVRGVR
jgi:DNA polymerase III epsilon subunit family exonuclease